MLNYSISAKVQRVLADTLTPVAAYLRLREFFPRSLLLESSDYHAAENCFSYICCDPIAELEISGGLCRQRFPDGRQTVLNLADLCGENKRPVEAALSSFLGRFSYQAEGEGCGSLMNGIFGYLSYDAVQYMEDLKLKANAAGGDQMPLLRYALYRYILAIDHFHDHLYLLENDCRPGTKGKGYNILNLASKPDFHAKKLVLEGGRESNINDEQHLELIRRCQEHIRRGDVFQIVPSRRFRQRYSGDDINVYRALRSVNPSPYLFYFDCGEYRIFGSSPETQLVVKNGKASIFPIAGTYRRTGNDQEDAAAARRLQEDPKESAEHVMLVDLARNDLSIHCYPVTVERFKEVQLYSHVIHLVSCVTGSLRPDASPISVLTTTFPAGTLTGAPKYKAMELIDRYEPESRNFYGGAVGFIGFNGEINHAITIRAFLSRGNVLYSQAGGGVVADSRPENEVEEVKNKLAALEAACVMAEEISR